LKTGLLGGTGEGSPFVSNQYFTRLYLA